MRRTFHITAALMLATAILTGFASKPRAWDRQAAERKAEYAFLQANVALSLDSLDAAMSLLDRAAALDPGNADIRGMKGLMRLMYDQLDSAGTAQAYEAMLALFRTNPSDYGTGHAVGTMARRLMRLDDMIYVWTMLDSLHGKRTEPALNLSDAYFLRYATHGDTADYRQALAILDNLEKGTGRNPGLTSRKVNIYGFNNDTAAIRRDLDSLIADFPDDPTPNLLAGSIYQSLNMDTLALTHYRSACRIDSADGRSFVQLANLYREMGDSVSYDREVFQALESQNLDFDTKFELLRGYVSELYTDSAQWPRTEHMFQTLQQVNPGESRMHALYGSFEYERGRLERAAEQFTYAMALDPGEDNIRTSVVQIYLTLDSVGAVLAASREGMKLFPDNFFYPVVAASTLARDGRTAEAIALLDSVDIGDVGNKRALSNFLTTKADVLYQAGEAEQAFDTYEEALRLNPDNVMAYNNAAYFLSEKGRDLDKALRYAQYAVLSEPSNATYLDTYAWVYFKRKDYPNARKQIDATLRALDYPLLCDSAACDTTGLTFEMPSTDFGAVVDPYNIGPDSDGDLVEVDENLVVEEIAEAPSSEVLSHAGDIYFMTGEPEAALAFWKEALELDPENELLARKVKYKTYFFE